MSITDVGVREPSHGEEFLGDGLFVSYDGWQFKLRAPHGDVDHEVFLEPGVLEAFNEYVKRCTTR